jgi:hypothetical protein
MRGGKRFKQSASGTARRCRRLQLDLPHPLGGWPEGWIELGRLLEVGSGAILVAAGEPRIAAVVVSRCVGRIDLDRQVVVGNGALIVLDIPPDIAAVVVVSGYVRPKADRFGMI